MRKTILSALTRWYPAEMAEADLAVNDLPPGPAGAPMPDPAVQSQVGRDPQGRFAAQQQHDPASIRAAEQFEPQQQVAPEAPVEQPQHPWEGKTAEEIWKSAEPFKKDLDTVKAATKDWRELAPALGPDNASALISFGRAFASGDIDAVAQFHSQLGEILKANGRETPAGQAPAAPPEFDPFNPDQIDQRVNQTVQQALAARDQQAAQERAVETIKAHMASLATAEDIGIPELADPTSAEYEHVLLMAQRVTEGDPQERLTTAARAFAEQMQKRAQALLATKQRQTTVPASPANGAAPSSRQEPKTLDDARRSAEQRLRLGATPGT